MKASLFSPILILLIITLFAKASMLFGRIQEQTSYSVDTSTSSVLVDTAYAKSSPESEKSDNSLPEDTNSNKKPKEEPTKAAADNPGAVITDNPGKAEKKPLDNLSRSEMDLLKELSKRRDILDKEKKDMNVREQVLKATENKIDQKVGELKNLQSQLEVLMKQYDQKENSKILSLVKIYETMKPKDAAKIFNELEMPVLLKVVSNMKEVKVAPVIASMDPVKARDLSIELAKQKPIE
jgi:flagellar motility protein MotE (MotC chaperone)